LAQGGCALIARLGQGAARITQQRLANDLVGRHPVGREECLRFARAQRVAADRIRETALLPARKAAQGQGDREGHVPGVETILQLGSQPPRQEQTPFHPSLFARQKLGDGDRREPVLLCQGSDHAGLIHRAASLGRRVGLEQAGLAGDPQNRFDDHGYLAQAIGTPLRQTLEAVEHLEVSVVPVSYAQR
jgi:hypothetical protein